MEENKVYTCWNCNKKFPTRAFLDKHKTNMKHTLDTVNMNRINISPSDIVSSYVEMALAELETLVGGQDITPGNILIFTLSMEQIVEKYGELKGSEKKELVIKTFSRYFDLNGGDKHGAMNFLPGFIDVSISLDKGEASIKMDLKDVQACCGFFSRKKK